MQAQRPTAAQQTAAPPPALDIPDALTVGDMASLMGAAPIEVIKQLMRNGFMLTINDALDREIASLLAKSFGFQVKAPLEEAKGSGSLVISSDEEDPALLEPRAPVVTILGHVDHGKTTLLDGIRHSSIVTGEAGGITQHIGAYQVEYDGHPLTFLDTPGHEAFTAMRARGAQVTDIAVLVVAADDGIMPQTIEAIDHVKAAGVPMIVAINKIDRPEADQERVKRQLAEHDLLIEEWGGDVIAVPVSALTGDGTGDLLSNILVVAEVGDLKANSNQMARGVVVEASIDKSKGPLATVLVQTGTLRVADNVVAGTVKGRVKAMIGDGGKRVRKVGPSVPVEILGLDSMPIPGDSFAVVLDEKTAKETVEARRRERELSRGASVSLEQVHSRMESGEIKALNLVVKTDVQGSVDAIRSALEGLSTEETRVNLLHDATGSITESDVLLAVASKAIVVGFNASPEPGARLLAKQESIDIRFYNVIYDLIDEVEMALQGLLEPVVEDVVEGYATVRGIFDLGRGRKAAGIYVNTGRISRGTEIHVLRNDERLFAGPMVTLRHFKEDVREVPTGLEGGIVLEGFHDYQEGDIIEAHRSVQAE